jgi:hypothetical protein
MVSFPSSPITFPGTFLLVSVISRRSQCDRSRTRRRVVVLLGWAEKAHKLPTSELLERGDGWTSE